MTIESHNTEGSDGGLFGLSGVADGGEGMGEGLNLIPQGVQVAPSDLSTIS